MKGIWNQSEMIYLCVAITLCALYIPVMLTLSYSLPFSLLYKSMRNLDDLTHQVEKTTEIRQKNGQQYFQSMSHEESSLLYKNRLEQQSLTFVFGIITVPRNRESNDHSSYGYLLQSASLLDRVLKQYAFFNRSVPFICNVDMFPQKHSDAVYLYKFMPYTERYGSNNMGLDTVKLPDSNKSFADHIRHVSKYHKETTDYTFCLLSAAALNPEYIVLVEDDALVHKDFPTVLEHILMNRLKVNTQHSHSRKFAYLKLYYPTKWQGFGFELDKFLDLLSWSVVGGSLFTVLCICYLVRRKSTSYSVTKLFLIGCFVTMITCWMIGRQNVNELRRLSKYLYRLQHSEGCCTQAMLYPIETVDTLSRYLVANKGYQHTDLAILDFIAVNQLQTYQVEPSLFCHVGFHTTLHAKEKDPEEFILNI